MKNNLVLAIFAASSYAFLFTACDSKEEKVRKENLENKADALEKQGKDMKKDADATADALKKDAKIEESATKKDAENAEKAAKDQAEAIKNAGDRAKDEKENEADKVRDGK